jgi:predicted RNA-binding protein with PIN domain
VDVPDEALRPGLELAFVVAVLGTRQRPPIPPPPSLKRFLRFQKLPSAALAPVRKVVEEDEPFRTRVAGVATETTVDRPSWLWLHRPDGWEADLEAAVAEASARADDERPAGSLARRLEASEAKLRRVSAELAVLRDEVTRAQHARAKAETEAGKAQARQAELERAAERARQRSDQASADLVAAREASDAVAAENQELQACVSQLEAQLHAALDAPIAAMAEPATDEPAMDAAAPTVLATPDNGPAWPRQARDALEGAASAAASLAASLSELAASLAGGGTAVAPPPPPSAPSRPPARPAETSAYAPRRRPLRVPRGMHLGTPEADSWLLTEAEAAVVVDGYNVAKLGWPHAALVDQRERLLDVLDDLTCRYGTTVEVVFDGADVGPVRPGRRRRVGVRFSPPTVSADDVIRDLVAGFPPTEPVVVVTNDRAVAHDVRAAGANVVSSDGLLAVARR